MEIRPPTKAELAAILTTIGMIGQLFGWTLPTQNRAEANKTANYECRDQLQVCNDGIGYWREKYVEHMEEDH